MTGKREGATGRAMGLCGEDGNLRSDRPGREKRGRREGERRKKKVKRKFYADA